MAAKNMEDGARAHSQSDGGQDLRQRAEHLAKNDMDE